MLLTPAVSPSRVVAPVLLVGLAVCSAGASHAAGEEAGRGLSTNWSHVVSLRSSSLGGLEQGISRQSHYAQGIALDAKGRYAEAVGHYRQADQEFRRMELSANHRERSRIRGWRLKAQQQQSLSYTLNRQSFYRYRSRLASYYQSHRDAHYLHQKWLAIRAFGVDPPAALVERALQGYRGALRLRSSYVVARLQLAALLLDIGKTREGREEFARAKGQIGSQQRYVAYWFPLAHYHALNGDHELALELLTKLAASGGWRKREILRSNAFDILRSDPRFTRIVGSP